MRLSRALLGIVGLLAIAGTGACRTVVTAKAASAAQVSSVTVEVSPNTTTAGSRVTVRANCADNSESATITSPALGGTLTAQRPNMSSTLLVVDVDISPAVTPGTFDVTVTCRSGATAVTKLTVVSVTSTIQPTVGPHTGGGFLAGREDDANPATPWLAGSGAALALAAAVAGVSVRRRRRVRRQDGLNRGALNPDALTPGALNPPAFMDR